MKISKKVLLYVGVTAYVFLVGIMGFVLSQQFGEKRVIAAELEATLTNFETLNTDTLVQQKADFENQFLNVDSKTEVLKENMSPQIGNVDASAIIFDIAQRNKVEITELSSPNPSIDYLDELPCNVVTLSATATGPVHDLLDFISRVNSELNTGVIQSMYLSIRYGETQTTSNVTIFLQVYNYRGD